MHGWALLHASMAINGPTPAGLGELRQIESLHGLSPRALLNLRWRVVAEPVPVPLARTQRAKATGIDRRSRLLAAVAKAEQACRR